MATFLPCLIKQESYALKCLCLEYAQYKNPPKDCRQSINYAIKVNKSVYIA